MKQLLFESIFIIKIQKISAIKPHLGIHLIEVDFINTYSITSFIRIIFIL